MTDPNALEPCPFCGGIPDISKHFKEEMWRLLHKCPVVGAITMDWTSPASRLVKRWNRRAPHAPADWAQLTHLAKWLSAVGNDEDAALMNRLLETKPAAIGAHPAPAAPRWMPIATAPKDGSPFWGEDGDDAIRVFWHPGFAEFISSFSRMTMAPGYTIDDQPFKDHAPVIHKPKRWMPMPETEPEPPTDE